MQFSSNNNNKVAVIDAGTNTFHLLISTAASPLSDPDQIRLRKYVKLGEESPFHIGEMAFDRGLNAMREFAQIAKSERVEKIVAVGTAMLRNANNSNDFIRAVKRETGIEIEVISGQTEAELIFKGALLSGNLSGETDLLMDIGGGSVEFIIAEESRATWRESFNIGVSSLKHHFHQNDPLAEEDIRKLRSYIDEQIESLFNQLQGRMGLRLVGLSGTFDVIEEHMRVKKGLQANTIPLNEVKGFIHEILPLSLEARINHPSIPESRADLISVALVLVDQILSRPEISELNTSPYSIKEGLLMHLV